MNLADAIRQAALRQAEEQGQKEQAMASTHPEENYQEPQPPQFETIRASEPAQDFEPEPEEPRGAPDWQSEAGKLTIVAAEDQAQQLFAADSATGEPVASPEHPMGVQGGNAVRFEIFLSPEQLSCLFRALVATQHSMMTLREAANYLRIPAGTLEQLAGEGKIPALQIEGRWRFPKSGVDEWVMLQSFKEGEVGDAA